MSTADSTHSKPASETPAAPEAGEVPSRSISEPVRAMLWGKAAGRCQFAGCNRVLWKSPVTQEPVNIAEKAHIYAFSAGGPRGNAGVGADALNDIDNLMLVCHDCHRKMDQAADGGRYPAELLRAWKSQHEQRVECVTGIAPQMKSHVVLYGANIGAYGSPLTYEATAGALFPLRYPAQDRPIELGTVDGATRDDDSAFWTEEARNLERRFADRIGQPSARGELGHLSVFALAPQPLLIRLGTLLTDIAEVDVYQRRREPQTWCWGDGPADNGIRIIEPTDCDGIPALVIAISATVTNDRALAAIGGPASIWQVTVERPHNDWLHERSQLEEFRRAARQLLDRIKAEHGQNAMLHVFPAAPVAIVVELGRVRQPKADMAWRIYDQNHIRGGFVPALDIKPGDTP